MNILSAEFYPQGSLLTYYPSKSDGKRVLASSLAISPDHRYITWAINTVNNFTIKPHKFCKNFVCEALKTFKVKLITPEIIEYQPIFKKIDYRFADTVIEKNLQKFVDTFGMNYDIKEDYYVEVFNNNKNEPQESWNRTSDENDWNETWDDDELHSADWDYDHNNPAHNPAENPWIDILDREMKRKQHIGIQTKY
ncbi:MAG: hypothetical protein IPM82_03260 [Saprospiraceae bacterium]|nr:hypothetical protein [Saprospiraceae bacterium]